MPVNMCVLCRNLVCGPEVMDGCRKAFWQMSGDAGFPARARRLIRSKDCMAVRGLGVFAIFGFLGGEDCLFGKFLVADVY